MTQRPVLVTTDAILKSYYGQRNHFIIRSNKKTGCVKNVKSAKSLQSKSHRWKLRLRRARPQCRATTALPARHEAAAIERK
jgi:hypothetical protein